MFPQVLSAPAEAIFKDTNIEMTSQMTSGMHLYKEGGEQVGEEFRKKKEIYWMSEEEWAVNMLKTFQNAVCLRKIC